jgi:hypothetical protein
VDVSLVDEVFVIFITFDGVCWWFLGAFDGLGGDTPSLSFFSSWHWRSLVEELHFSSFGIMLAGLVVFSHVLALLITPWLAHLMVMEHAISSWCGFGILVYLGGATSCSWMMVLAPQGVR